MNGSSDPAEGQAWRRVEAESCRSRAGQETSLAESARQAHHGADHPRATETREKIISEITHAAGEVSETGGSSATLGPIPECATAADDESDPTATEECPYPGLASFGQLEARWFFGREQATSAVISHLDDRLAGGEPLAVMAPSGAGKSSLLAAGLIPALARGELPGSKNWPVVVTTPGAHPLASLAARVAQRIRADPAEVTAATADPERFTVFLAAHAGSQGKTRSSARIVLIVDQFEEVFTECQQELERQAFIAALCAAAQSGAVLVVLGMRADFYGSCLKYPALVTALQNPVALGPMSTDQLRSIITGPAEAENLEVEPGLVELLLRDLGVAHDPSAATAGYDPGALPLLAHALRATWQQRDGRLLTVAGYRRTGGIREAIATTAEHAYNQLDSPEQRTAQELLLRLVNVSEHTRALRRRLPPERLVQSLSVPAQTSGKVLESFGRARLLTLDTTSVEITHEALMWAWPRLADWINADRPGLRIRQMLSEAAEVWEAENRDPSLLYRGPRLAIAQDWTAESGKAQLSALERAYLQASIDHIQREQHTQRRHTRHLRTLVSVLALALVMALIAGGMAFQLYYDAKKQRDRVASIELSVKAGLFAAKHPDAAMLTALKAVQSMRSSVTRSALLSAQSQYFSGQLSGHGDVVNSALFSPDGSILVTAGKDGTVRLWNAVSRDLIDVIDTHGGPVDGAEFSPDGSIIATANRDGTVRLWNAADRKFIDRIEPLKNDSTYKSDLFLSSVRFSHRGNILAIVNNGGVQLWDVPGKSPIARLSARSIGKVVFSPDDRILASLQSEIPGKNDSVSFVVLFDVANPSRPQILNSLPITEGRVQSVAFNPGGNTLAAAGYDRAVHFWDVRDPSRPRKTLSSLDGHMAPVSSVVFSPDGNTLLTGSDDRTARLWDVTTRQTIAILSGHDDAIKGAAFNQDGSTVVTASGDGTAMLWRIKGPILVSSPFPINQGGRVEFSPDGRVLAATTKDGVWLWDARSRRQIVRLPGRIADIEFSESSHILATMDVDGTVGLWDLRNLADLQPVVTLHPGVVGKMTFSPNGEIFAIANSFGQTVQLWGVADLGRPEKLEPALKIPENFITAIEFSRDSGILAVGSVNGAVQLLDVSLPRQPKVKKKLSWRGDELKLIRKMVFNSDDTILTVVRVDGTVQRREIESGRDLGTVGISDATADILADLYLLGDQANVYHGGFGSSDKAEKMAISDEGRTAIILLDTSKAKPEYFATLTGHTGTVKAVSFSRDGRFLASIDEAGAVRVWDLDEKQVAAHLCEIIGTADKWKKIFRSDSLC